MYRLTKLLLLFILPLLFACTQKEPEVQEVRVESVTISQSSAEIEIGKTLQLNATVSPSTATRKDITWSSSKSSVASVSSSGLVTAVSEGTTTITAAADGKKGECMVSVVKKAIAVSEIKLDKTELTLFEGEEETLTASVLPEDATDKTITWTSSDKSIASVESGKVKAVGKGEATITAKAGEKTAEAKVIVLTPISGLSLNKDQVTLYIGETETLEATLSPADATLKDPISWSSSNESIAKVDGGKITAIGKGTAKITATGGGKSASCTIEVLRPVSGISLNKTELELPLDGSETLTATVIPSDATLREEITWSSSNTQVATVDGGKVTAVGIGTATITVSLEGFKAECTVTVKGMEYGKIAITDLKPVEILPFIGQVATGDKQVYDHIEHLGLAEATRIRDMMWEYGAGNNSQQQYQQLMGRLNTGMIGENPKGVDNYEMIGGSPIDEPSGHAYIEWSILTSIVKHATFIVLDNWSHWEDLLYEFCNNSPFKINIMGISVGSLVKRDIYDLWNEVDNEQYDKVKNCLLFSAAGNVKVRDGILNNKLYQEELDLPDESSRYGFNSRAHSKNDVVLDRHLMITIATDEDGDIDQTNEKGESSLFPVGFHDKVLFSGRILPYKKDPEDGFRAPDGKYNTSFTNYVNVVLADLCFQLYAEVADVDELLEMIRSTALTDYIRFDLNGDGDTNDIYTGQPETQPLQLINPAGLYKKYLTPQNLPASISSGETVNLDKGYYKGVLFSIPGAEVKINGEWIAFDNKNKDIILSKNPMNLEWRLNGELLKKYGYISGQTVEGQIITVDDKWGGLRLEVPMTIQVR